MSRPPSKGDFWRAFAAVTILPINGSQKAIFGCLIDHANPKTGLCYPSEALIAAETGHPIRTVERAVAGLLLTPYLSRKQRPQSSNDYAINFDVLLKAWDAYKGRGAAYRASKAGDQETVTETVTDRSRKAKSSPSKVAASLLGPAGEVKNVGGVLARFERTFERDPSSIPDLSGWLSWLEDEALYVESDMSDRNAQRARRLAHDVRYYLDEAA